MAQDLVTAKDVATSLQFQDPQLICDMLDEALPKEKQHVWAYSKPIRSLFQVAWAAASQSRNTQVTVFHLAYALLRSQPEAGKELAACLGTDAESFFGACIVKFLSLGVPVVDRAILPPAVDTVRWLEKGAALALKRGENSELLPADLVRAVQEGTIDSSVRNLLRAAARLGAVRRDALPGSSAAPAIPTTPPTPEDIVKDIREIQTAGSTDLDVLLDEFESQKQILLAADKRLALIERRVQPIDDVASMLENIDRRLTGLPRAPSGARLATAIVAVLVLGVAAGLALQFPQPWGALLAQVLSAR